MRINTRKIVVAVFALLLPLVASAQDENPFIGVWDLDKPDSNFGSSAVPANMIRTYADAGDGAFMYLLVTINEDGSIGGSSATYKYDNQENTIASLNPDAQARISYRKVNEKTVEYTVRVDGLTTQIGAKSITPDGSVLTIVIQNLGGQVNNQILKFDRRR
ncbi:MAG: hypothetical protein COB20_04360 [SAR86 cluster bacterium]|uniref:Lipocalin-like domain-containing protein n=1 Tax=SAR86 cluster bacterium TaxID=2030880 RepID=A0A2A4XAN6_9GAMM|nr:MAG: hypothetical protein COB20_04360 [SAR86 cluster bacterium]